MARRTHIRDARQVCEATGARQAIVLVFYGDDAGPQLSGRVAGSSYGATSHECVAVASVLDTVVDLLIKGRIRGPR